MQPILTQTKTRPLTFESNIFMDSNSKARSCTFSPLSCGDSQVKQNLKDYTKVSASKSSAYLYSGSKNYQAHTSTNTAFDNADICEIDN